MLVLSRKKNESILIGDDIKVTVTDIGSGKIRIGIDAPKDVLIIRGEIAENSTGRTIFGQDQVKENLKNT